MHGQHRFYPSDFYPERYSSQSDRLLYDSQSQGSESSSQSQEPNSQDSIYSQIARHESNDDHVRYGPRTSTRRQRLPDRKPYSVNVVTYKRRMPHH